jgi:hypothetical protein
MLSWLVKEDSRQLQPIVFPFAAHLPPLEVPEKLEVQKDADVVPARSVYYPVF